MKRQSAAELLSLADAVRIAGNTDEWKGNCYGVACKIADAGVLPSAIGVYGAYRGPVAATSQFKRGMPFQRHGWVLFGNRRLLDPTRWVFEDVAPYLFWAKADHRDYDEGNNGIRQVRPPPAFKHEGTHTQVFFPFSALSERHWKAICNMLDKSKNRPCRTITITELFWLANLPLQYLGKNAKPLFEALHTIGRDSAVPIDNFKRVIEGRWAP